MVFCFQGVSKEISGMKGINAEMTSNYSEQFCTSFNLKNLIMQTTYFQNLENQTRIKHIFTNHTERFHSSSVYEKGLPDFYNLTLTVLKVFHVKHRPKSIQYRDFDNT